MGNKFSTSWVPFEDKAPDKEGIYLVWFPAFSPGKFELAIWSKDVGEKWAWYDYQSNQKYKYMPTYWMEFPHPKGQETPVTTDIGSQKPTKVMLQKEDVFTLVNEDGRPVYTQDGMDGAFRIAETFADMMTFTKKIGWSQMMEYVRWSHQHCDNGRIKVYPAKIEMTSQILNGVDRPTT